MYDSTCLLFYLPIYLYGSYIGGFGFLDGRATLKGVAYFEASGEVQLLEFNGRRGGLESWEKRTMR